MCPSFGVAFLLMIWSSLSDVNEKVLEHGKIGCFGSSDNLHDCGLVDLRRLYRSLAWIQVRQMNFVPWIVYYFVRSMAADCACRLLEKVSTFRVARQDSEESKNNLEVDWAWSGSLYKNMLERELLHAAV